MTRAEWFFKWNSEQSKENLVLHLGDALRWVFFKVMSFVYCQRLHSIPVCSKGPTRFPVNRIKRMTVLKLPWHDISRLTKWCTLANVVRSCFVDTSWHWLIEASLNCCSIFRIYETFPGDRTQTWLSRSRMHQDAVDEARWGPASRWAHGPALAPL